MLPRSWAQRVDARMFYTHTSKPAVGALSGTNEDAGQQLKEGHGVGSDGTRSSRRAQTGLDHN